MNTLLLVVDQGTTSTRAIVFDGKGGAVAIAQQEFAQIYPHPGWVEHDPEDLWSTTPGTLHQALEKPGFQAREIAGIGIANQRETTPVWDRSTGKPICNAVIWQDRRTAEVCEPQCARLPPAGRGTYEPPLRPLLLYNQDRMDPRQCRGRAAPGGARRIGVRYRRYVPSMAADRRCRPRNRCHQRNAHVVIRYPCRPVG
jgi:sugar (pentulose or hexulose) kinase